VLAQHKVLAHFASMPAPGTEEGGQRAVLTGYLRAEQQLGRISPGRQDGRGGPRDHGWLSRAHPPASLSRRRG
jgi:hypothetical protein